MKRVYPALIALLFTLGCNPNATTESTNADSAPDTSNELKVYELRTYYAAEGKLDDLLSRFRDHTTSLFEKHGMTNVAYWVPVENEDSILVYILGYPSRAERGASWTSFREDPDWIEAKSDSEEDGSLIDSVQSLFLTRTDFSPEFAIEEAGPRVFELRTYYTNEGKLPDLHARFRDHTLTLFEKHGMTNIVYFDLDTDQPGVENTLLYFISHESVEAASQNWQAFISDAQWQSVYEASIEEGALVDSLTSMFLRPVDFSPTQ